LHSKVIEAYSKIDYSNTGYIIKELVQISEVFVTSHIPEISICIDKSEIKCTRQAYIYIYMCVCVCVCVCVYKGNNVALPRNQTFCGKTVSIT